MKKFNLLPLVALQFLSISFATAIEPLPTAVPFPKDNPQTPAKIELGKKLFFDPRLSKDGTVSCNSCHNVFAGGDDGRAVSAGVGGKLGKRNAPTVWNSAFMSVLFWDGRAATLEEQAILPLINPVEMAMESKDAVIQRLKQIEGYGPEFKKAFPNDNDLTIENVGKALAAYQRTLVTPNSPMDKYLRGNKKAISEQAIRGLKKFEQLGCGACHMGPAMAGPPMAPGKGYFQTFPINPKSPFVGLYKLNEDFGRFEATKDENDKFLWRVPTLRNVAITAPYFHNGAVKSLDEAVKAVTVTQFDITLTDDETKDLVAFLETLTGEQPKQTMPQLPLTPSKALF